MPGETVEGSLEKTFIDRIKSSLTEGVGGPLYRVAAAVIIAAVGYFVHEGIIGFTIFLLVLYLVLVGIIEVLLTKTRNERTKEIRNETQKIEAETRKIEVDLDRFSSSTEFLITRFRNTTDFLSDAFPSDRNGSRVWAYRAKRKTEIIGDTLHEMCRILRSTASRLRDMPETKITFRATYMEVVMAREEEVLQYLAWYTPDNTMPRSASEGKHFRKGEGCAGIAWERGKVVIEDRFEDGHEWKNNYLEQGKKYKSMACIPVLKQATAKVIGVITADSNLEGFFGKKNDRDDEEEIGRMVQPYAQHIAFVSVLDELLKTIDEKNLLGGVAAPSTTLEVDSEVDTLPGASPSLSAGG